MLLLLVYCFGVEQTFAQKNIKHKRAIILKLYFENTKEPEITELPLNLNEVLSESAVGGKASSYTCGECDESKLPASYFFSSLHGSVVSKGKAKLFLSVDVNKTCKVRKIFFVTRDQQIKFKLNCSVNLIAHYGFESKENNEQLTINN